MGTPILRRIDKGIEFYTVEATGESGLSDSGLAMLCGVSHQAIKRIKKALSDTTNKELKKQLETIEDKDSKVATKFLKTCLSPFIGMKLTVDCDTMFEIDGYSLGNMEINRADFCVAVRD